MRVMWLCNIMPPIVAEKLSLESSVKEGWITGMLNAFLTSGESNMDLAIVFPIAESLAQYQDVFVWNGIRVACYGFCEDMINPEKYQPVLETRFEHIIDDYKPDVIHIFGTEYPHALAMAKVVRNKKKLLVGMQGVITRCAEEYQAELPQKIVKRKTIRDRLKKDGILDQQSKFTKRGRNEVRTLKLVGNVTGRTDFDREFCKEINPDAVYYAMNETMRPCFYEGKWAHETCKQHTIFFSQADYPLKGFHFLLEAMPYILEKYPDAKIVVAGNDIIRSGILGWIKRPSYGKYLRSLTVSNHLSHKIHFLGRLSAEEMKQEYLKCHTTVCASVLENSPNSVAEAMLLGVPVVCANVGGVPSMVKDGKEGLLFEKGNVKQLAEAVIKIWEEDSLAEKLGKAAQIRAKKTHDREANVKRLMEIYHAIGDSKE